MKTYWSESAGAGLSKTGHKKKNRPKEKISLDEKLEKKSSSKNQKVKTRPRKKKLSQNPKVSLVNLLFLNEFCEFRH